MMSLLTLPVLLIKSGTLVFLLKTPSHANFLGQSLTEMNELLNTMFIGLSVSRAGRVFVRASSPGFCSRQDYPSQVCLTYLFLITSEDGDATTACSNEGIPW